MVFPKHRRRRGGRIKHRINTTALVLFGFLGDAPADLIEWRTPLFQAAAQDYVAQRRIVDSVPTEQLQLTPDQVRARLADWRSLVLASSPSTPAA